MKLTKNELVLRLRKEDDDYIVIEGTKAKVKGYYPSSSLEEAKRMIERIIDREFGRH